jgi:hypothetical protein
VNKFVLVSILPIIIMFNTNACSGGVEMSIPHIHDEDDFLLSVRNAEKGELKKVNISQVLAGKIEHSSHDKHLIVKDVKWAKRLQQVN